MRRQNTARNSKAKMLIAAMQKEGPGLVLIRPMGPHSMSARRPD